MATTEEYKNGGSASYTFSIEKIKDEDIKVSVDGTDLTYTQLTLLHRQLNTQSMVLT